MLLQPRQHRRHTNNNTCDNSHAGEPSPGAAPSVSVNRSSPRPPTTSTTTIWSSSDAAWEATVPPCTPWSRYTLMACMREDPLQSSHPALVGLHEPRMHHLHARQQYQCSITCRPPPSCLGPESRCYRGSRHRRHVRQPRLRPLKGEMMLHCATAAETPCRAPLPTDASQLRSSCPLLGAARCVGTRSGLQERAAPQGARHPGRNGVSASLTLRPPPSPNSPLTPSRLDCGVAVPHPHTRWSPSLSSDTLFIPPGHSHPFITPLTPSRWARSRLTARASRTMRRSWPRVFRATCSGHWRPSEW